jgi:hypothetical protein
LLSLNGYAQKASMPTVSKQVHTLIEAMYLAGLAL